MSGLAWTQSRPRASLAPSHLAYLDQVVDAEPFCVGWARRWWPDSVGMPRFMYLAEGAAKRWGWGRVDEDDGTVHRIALRIEARRVADWMHARWPGFARAR